MKLSDAVIENGLVLKQAISKLSLYLQALSTEMINIKLFACSMSVS